MIVGCLLYLVILSPKIFPVTLPFVGLGALGYQLAHLRAIKHLRAGASEQERLFGHFRAFVGRRWRNYVYMRAEADCSLRDTVLRQSIETVRRERTAGMALFSSRRLLLGKLSDLRVPGRGAVRMIAG